MTANQIISDSLREKLEMRRQRRSRMRTKSQYQFQLGDLKEAHEPLTSN
jgi:hypothetical protein